MMMRDHHALRKAGQDLAKKLNVTPAPPAGDTSQTAAQHWQDNLTATPKGDAWDKAYIDHEVAYHQAVLDAVDKTLIPNAKNEELKALLVKVRPAFVAHLEHAKQIQASLGK